MRVARLSRVPTARTGRSGVCEEVPAALAYCPPLFGIQGSAGVGSFRDKLRLIRKLRLPLRPEFEPRVLSVTAALAEPRRRGVSPLPTSSGLALRRRRRATTLLERFIDVSAGFGMTSSTGSGGLGADALAAPSLRVPPSRIVSISEYSLRLLRFDSVAARRGGSGMLENSCQGSEDSPHISARGVEKYPAVYSDSAVSLTVGSVRKLAFWGI